MKFSLVPDYIFDKFNDLTPQFLSDLGIKAVLLDIDNTLEPYENALPGDHVKKMAFRPCRSRYKMCFRFQ